MMRTERPGRSHPLTDLLMDLTPAAGAFPLALIEALIDRAAPVAQMAGAHPAPKGRAAQ